jgi:murein DD-endopeptidase MepM/ murein hydrolase activator NlpD
MIRKLGPALVSIALVVAGCGGPEAPRPSLQDAPTHERYTSALSEFGLDNVALGRDWLAEAGRAIAEPLPAKAPFVESGFFPGDRPTAFPIPDRSLSAVQSGFGAPRDGGARDHHGIDIFAPRGTPVIAIADGMVRTDDTPRGGRVVWLREARLGRNLYYAHLNDWAVPSGTPVRVGDIIGYVGNTGNARTTPPHLHFGIYDRGPTDPAPFLWRDDPVPPRLTLSLAPIGSWVHDRARVMAARRNEYRLLLPDGSFAFVAARDLGSSQ